MKRLFIYIVFIVIAAKGYSQEASLQYIKSIKGDIADFAVDNMDNIYLINSSNQLKKLNSNGDSVAVFNNVRKYGKATYIDVSNPLRILLYYKDFLTIVVLDRFLNVQQTIDLRKQNIYQVKAVGLSYDNNIWLYDELESKLKKIDADGKLLSQTTDFRQLFNQPPSPQYILDKDQLVYLYDSLKGVYSFDYYGTLKNNLVITGWSNFTVVNNNLFGNVQDTLYRYNVKDVQMKKTSLPFISNNIHLSSVKLYMLKEDEVFIYLLK